MWLKKAFATPTTSHRYKILFKVINLNLKAQCRLNPNSAFHKKWYIQNCVSWVAHSPRLPRATPLPWARKCQCPSQLASSLWSANKPLISTSTQALARLLLKMWDQVDLCTVEACYPASRYRKLQRQDTKLSTHQGQHFFPGQRTWKNCTSFPTTFNSGWLLDSGETNILFWSNKVSVKLPVPQKFQRES